ncbi:esterase-like activity of phytase family protein [Halodurantibacterium flavum]|uniref:Esterase-like activity of phytase family protein n=1 Tax=Halodurantibacterium flavum TaxID=1382802 RepID=A0ABW4S7M8_9RHOB
MFRGCLGALAVLLCAGGAIAQTAEHAATVIWPAEAHGFGGFSAIEVSGNGRDFIAVSDRGAILTGSFDRDAVGNITAIASTPPMMLRGTDGTPLPEHARDAEGIAVDGAGRILISFEGVHRIFRYDDPRGPATALPVPDEFARFPANGSLEALAIDADGMILTLPEQSDDPRGFPVFVFADDVWRQPFHVPRLGRFLPVGADFGPDGHLYLLERDFSLLGGFASRVRRFEIGQGRLEGGEILLQSRRGQHDNLEGISVWADPAGGLRLTLIADDNFFRLQRTEIVEYRLAP